MNSPSRPRPRQSQAQAPRDYDDLPSVYHNSGGLGKGAPSSAASAAAFNSHDDFYDFLDSNRGPPSAPTSSGGHSSSNTIPAQQSQMPSQQPRFRGDAGQQPSHSPTTQSRPPITNSFPSGSGSEQQPQRSSRPPSYSGSSRSEEMLVAGDRGGESSSGRVQRQNGRRGGGSSKPMSGPRPPTSSSGGSSPPRASNGYPMTHPHIAQAQAQSSKSASASASDPSLSVPGASLGASIQRLKSPSVLDCVLQPLDAKVGEWAGVMQREQDEMDRLDAELRALQERRADAETRFLEAKGKHDDYRRQYVDVERAMRGEGLPPPTPRDMMPPPQGHQGQPLSRQPTRPMSLQEDDDDDDDDFGPPPSSAHRRINSQQSFGRSSQKGRFRFSLFGGK
ncbi:hypothetical protein F4821DRAFT_44294 [Hypoxylon rubiginosum]|uniref:Uncharacterized protein n=1 Tax=Hypoxylon rubiginosum TaxID=110542 RepID=A0ACC0DAX3_9PEZI|nr:hypothetical protein F4821DRAFT_44294 [Hypoxylon rubiginosum]